MKIYLFPALKLTLLSLFLFGFLYPLFVWGLAQFSPGQGMAKTLVYKDEKQYVHIGQLFNTTPYFWSRPSAVNYNAAASGASNKGPSNPAYLTEVAERITHFMQAHPTLSRQDVPVEMVTASGSGLDPHISVAAARVQVARVAKARGLGLEQVEQLIDAQRESSILGLMGPEQVNVLLLNIALDGLGK